LTGVFTNLMARRSQLPGTVLRPTFFKIPLAILRQHPVRLNSFAILLGALIVTAAFPISGTTSYASKVNYLPDVTLTNQNAHAISLSSLRGRSVLVGFIHTNCKGVCQMMTANMRSIASALPSATAAGVTMLLITTDPAEDQPPQLLQYAKNQDLAGKGWILVTGPQDSIKRVMRLYGVKHEETDDAMMHVMKLFLLAPGGTLARVYPGMKVSPQTVASDIETLSRRNSNAASQPLGATR
jgi:cytochrome oxidase Cu insertion factor (SCO1/SenC/PrrC family)